jgi:hypothetical protein
VLSAGIFIAGLIKSYQVSKHRCKSTYSEKNWNFFVRCQLETGHKGKHEFYNKVIGAFEWLDETSLKCIHLNGTNCHNPQFEVHEKCNFFFTQELCSCYKEET